MKLDMQKIRTQDEIEEPAAIDQANERVEATMKDIEREAKEQVSEGLRDKRSEEEDASKRKAKKN